MASRSEYTRAATSEGIFSGESDDIFAELGPESNTLILGAETKEERKRRWWRNGIVNAIFIAIWCVVSSGYSCVSYSYHTFL